MMLPPTPPPREEKSREAGIGKKKHDSIGHVKWDIQGEVSGKKLETDTSKTAERMKKGEREGERDRGRERRKTEGKRRKGAEPIPAHHTLLTSPHIAYITPGALTPFSLRLELSVLVLVSPTKQQAERRDPAPPHL